MNELLIASARSRGGQHGNQNALFWDRNDIEEARKLLDLWAGCKKHAVCHPGSFPEATEILGPTAPPFQAVREGLMALRAGLPGGQDLSLSTVAGEFVDRVLTSLDLLRAGKRSIWEGLLLHLYPREGRYKSEPGNYRSYRPWALLRGMSNKYLERSADGFLRQVEREILLTLVEAGRSPRGVLIPWGAKDQARRIASL